VLAPDTLTAPAPIVSSDVLSTFPLMITAPVFTVKLVVKVAFVTVPAFPVILPAIALVTVKSVAHNLVRRLVVSPIVCPVI